MTANHTNYNQKQTEVGTFCNLTEKWNKGELPEGDYYIERRNGYLLYDNIDSRGVWRNSIDEDIEEVLAPVPSYEEWKDTENRSLLTTEFSNEIDELNEENQQLKELLKECYKMLAQYQIENSEPSLGENIELLTKIDEVLK